MPPLPRLPLSVRLTRLRYVLQTSQWTQPSEPHHDFGQRLRPRTGRYKTHDEANRLALSLNRLKGLNNWLENKVKDLEKELYNSKEDLENPDLIYKKSSCNCEKMSCENCEVLEKKICYLLKTLDKLTTRRSNFENVLASRKCVFGKAGLRFYPQSKEKIIAKTFSNSLEKQSVKKSFQPVGCYMLLLHEERPFSRKSLVPKGIYKWIPRCIVNTKDKSNTEGPKFFKGSNLKI